MNTYIQNKLDEFEKEFNHKFTVWNNKWLFAEKLGCEDIATAQDVLEFYNKKMQDVFKDYHNYIVENIQEDLDNGRFYEICSNENSFIRYIKSLL